MSQIDKKKAIKAATFVLFGFGLSQILRLGGNIVLTRLLVPEFFGLIAIANVYFSGVGLFTDIGFGPAIIRSDRSNDPDFLNTAWTVQVLRGIFINIVTVIVAYPVSRFYNEPILFPILCVLSISASILGLQSTSIVLLNRDLQQGKLAMLELTSQIVSLTATISIAFFFRNIWALVVGSIASCIVEVIISHTYKNQKTNRFYFEKKAFLELFSFGKWIILSTAVMFLATKADRLLLGKVFTLGFFGVYSIAVTFAEIPKQIIERLSESIFYPIIANYNHLPRKELQNKIISQRKIIYLAALGVAVLACFGDYLILFLYDDRYVHASWILPMLALGIWPLVLHATTDRCLYALGNPKYSAMGNIAKFAYMIIFIPLSFHFFGILGSVIVVVCNDIPVYTIVNYGLIREKLNFLKQDFMATIVLILFVFLFLFLRVFLGLELPGQDAFLML